MVSQHGRSAPTVSRRIIEFDLLRGFFIVILTLDHLAYWPSPLALISGRGWLWVTAAEGFFLISGFLVGFIRGYKGRHKPIGPVTKNLLRRAFKLYVWGIGISLLLRIITEISPSDNTMPDLPEHDTLQGWLPTIVDLLRLEGFHDWIFFLRMYAVMLALAPVFVFLVQRNLSWLALALSLTGYALSFLQDLPRAELQWQILFFGAAFLGFHFNRVRNWMADNLKVRLTLITVLVLLTAITIITSSLAIHGAGTFAGLGHGDTYAEASARINPLFSNNPMMPGRILMSFLWFGGFMAVFHVFRRQIDRYVGWLLRPLGQRSLTAYCLQAIILPVIVLVTSVRGQMSNMLVGICTVLIIWLLLKSRFVQKVLPQ